jgi:hypothetical protein
MIPAYMLLSYFTHLNKWIKVKSHHGFKRQASHLRDNDQEKVSNNKISYSTQDRKLFSIRLMPKNSSEIFMLKKTNSITLKPTKMKQ